MLKLIINRAMVKGLKACYEQLIKNKSLSRTLVYTVQLNSNLTLVFDHSHVFTDFIRVPDQ